ncbi:MAG: ATP-binding protein [Oligoflexales bacterium]|nr:ATP-binding protein [Oligoflexales bacterium]
MRYLNKNLFKDLKKKMVFVGGPRQCGKTTLAKDILSQLDGEYLNWDNDEHRRRIVKKQFSPNAPLIVFDELHKMPRWKTWIKGLYDTKTQHQNYLVTGSARLDIYRRGGDSLLGRYHYWRLHPFTLDEHAGQFSSAEALERLMSVGGFPEPFLEGDPQQAARWRRERYDRILRDDLRDLENLRMIGSLYQLVELLRARVSSSIVISNLAEDLQVAPKTVNFWLEILERMYLLFIVRPYTGKLSRTVQRPPRVYFYDNMDVNNPEDKLLGARFENLVATHLLKRINYQEDATGDRYQLHYLRDKEKREVDFVITKNNKVEELIEVKYSDTSPSPSLLYYNERLKPEKSTQLVYNCDKTIHYRGIVVMGVVTYFMNSKLPPI